jgi:opacity protein-like surface antigen
MKIISVFVLVVTLFASAASANEFTPYVGLGLVVDKPGTSARRPAFDPAAQFPFIKEGGGEHMEFDTVFAGELTLGVKYRKMRGELQAAIRTASEDDVTLYSGPMPPMPNIDISTSMSVRHNSYLANVFYDFDIPNSDLNLYVGVGAGVGQYKQKAKAHFDIAGAPGNTLTVLDHDKIAFEWQAAFGAVCNFTKHWALDTSYRFNSATVGGKFVYAHELRLGARYSF